MFRYPACHSLLRHTSLTSSRCRREIDANDGEYIFRSFSHSLLASPREKAKTLELPSPRRPSAPIVLANFISEPHGEEENAMQSKKQFRNLISRTISRVAKIALATATVFALTVVLTQSAQAQIFKVIHAFSGGGDGGSPWAGLTIDKAGNLYGTASVGGADGDGTVYRLQYKGSGWVFTPLYSFRGSPDDGAYPSAAVVFGPGGSLYGTTAQGGVQECGNGSSPCGTVFNLKP